MTNRVCPEFILEMFKGDEDSKRTARFKAVEWAEAQVETMDVGDQILLPDGDTGELMSFTKIK